MALNVGELVTTLRADTTQLEQGLDDAQGQAEGFGKKLAAGLAIAGAAAGALLTKGLVDNLDIEDGQAKLAAQMNLTKEQSAQIGAVAGKVYAQNWGESLDQVNEAIRAVGQNLGDVTKMSAGDLEKLTSSALALSSVFDADMAESTEAAGKLIKNGLAKNAEDAFDIITKGFQTGLDRSGDFLDTINEYSPQFAKLGIDGAEALNLLQAALQAGARDTDGVADAFKEFSLRAIDGSTATADGFKAIGLDANKAAAAIAGGGDGANAMTMKVLQSLAAIKDPVAQNTAGVALFGTQWEDTLRQIVGPISQVKGGMDGVTGATANMANTAGNTGRGQIEALKRSFDGWVQSQIAGAGVSSTLVAGIAQFGGPALVMGASLGQIAAGLAAVNAGAALAAVRAGIASAATTVWTGVQWLWNAAMTANPIGLVIVAIAALVGIIIWAWKNNETFRKVVLAAWDGIKAGAVAVWGWISSFFVGLWNGIKAVASTVWGWISSYISTNMTMIKAAIAGISAIVGWFRNAFNAVTSTISGWIGSAVGLVRSIPGRIMGALGNLGSLLVNAGRALIQGLINGITSMAGSVMDKAKSVIGPIARLLPGSPVKEGPLRVLNDGYAGGKIVEMVADGMSVKAPQLRATAAETVGGMIGGLGRPNAGAGGAHVLLELRGQQEIAALIRRIVRVDGGGDVRVAFG